MANQPTKSGPADPKPEQEPKATADRKPDAGGASGEIKAGRATVDKADPQPEGGGEIAKRPQSIKAWLGSDAFSDAVRKAVPAHVSPDRMLRVAMTQITKVPKLAKCDQASFLSSMLDCSQLGLEPDGRMAHLIPFENRAKGITECQLIVGYQGLIELVYRSGRVTGINAAVVREGDEFRFSMNEVREHVPWEWRDDDERPPEPGEIRGAYVAVRMVSGRTHYEVMTTTEIEDIRKTSKAGRSGPWVTNWSEMAKKTVLRRAFKWLPKSSEVSLASQIMERQEPMVDANLTAHERSEAKRGSDRLIDAMKAGATFASDDDDEKTNEGDDER